MNITCKRGKIDRESESERERERERDGWIYIDIDRCIYEFDRKIWAYCIYICIY